MLLDSHIPLGALFGNLFLGDGHDKVLTIKLCLKFREVKCGGNGNCLLAWSDEFVLGTPLDDDAVLLNFIIDSDREVFLLRITDVDADDGFLLGFLVAE